MQLSDWSELNWTEVVAPGNMRFSSLVDAGGTSFFIVQLLICVPLSSTPWTAADQSSLSFTLPWILLKFMSIELLMRSNHLILCCLIRHSRWPSVNRGTSAQWLPRRHGGQDPPANAEIQETQANPWVRKTPWNRSCHFLLQEIFPTQGSNQHILHLLHWQIGSLPLHLLGSWG